MRQHVEIEADTRSASMINFVFPHHSLASYLLYEKTGKMIKRGYSIDLAVREDNLAIYGGPFASDSFIITVFSLE